jgi:hypothetical protein
MWIGFHIFGFPWMHMGEYILVFGLVVNLLLGAILSVVGYSFLVGRLNG